MGKLGFGRSPAPATALAEIEWRCVSYPLPLLGSLPHPRTRPVILPRASGSHLCRVRCSLHAATFPSFWPKPARMGKRGSSGRSSTQGRGLEFCRGPRARTLLSPLWFRRGRASRTMNAGPPPFPSPHTCAGNVRRSSGAPPAPPPSSHGPLPHGARLLGSHHGSRPDHAPPNLF
ncbi:hypothetical protein NDU88_004397 [Pleurodeles waltl]|uniref:Uncharacterized protein n=1 Tax=Pleurodeles waltl TaxID=8319 RepID=A0AAV7UJ30_PLEWA|nr:hypothetical protein NDU88_004397 [Pleurodeles waltl]